MSLEGSSNCSPTSVRSRPVQETNAAQGLPSSGRNLINQTISLPPPSGIADTATVQGAFKCEFSKSSAQDLSQVSSLGDSLVEEPQDAVQDNGHPAESYSAVLQRQTEFHKRPREWTESGAAEGYKKLAIEKEFEVRELKAKVKTLNNDKVSLIDKSASLMDENASLKGTNTKLTRDLDKANCELSIAKRTIQSLERKVEMLEDKHCPYCEEPRDDLAVKGSELYQRNLHPFSK